MLLVSLPGLEHHHPMIQKNSGPEAINTNTIEEESSVLIVVMEKMLQQI